MALPAMTASVVAEATTLCPADLMTIRCSAMPVRTTFQEVPGTTHYLAEALVRTSLAAALTMTPT
jgi:hypothetical protein